MTTYYVKTDARGVTSSKELEEAIYHLTEVRKICPDGTSEYVDLADIYGMRSRFPVKPNQMEHIDTKGLCILQGGCTWYRAVQIAVKKALGTYRGEFKDD